MILDPRRQAVIAEARSWIGTQFVHQGRVKATGTKRADRGGVDCLMLVRGVGEVTGMMAPVTPAQDRKYQKFYGRRPNSKVMRECLEEFLVEIDPADALPGDVTWSHWGNEMPIHMAVIGEHRGRRTTIHAVCWPGINRVVEQGMSDGFVERVTAWWRYPALAEAA